MAKTIEQGFNEFLTKLTPSGTESEAAIRHRASIKSCLEKNYGMTNFFRTGSFGNGTSIKGFSDVDYFAVIPRENLVQTSNTSLTNIRNTLDARFPNTGVRISSPSIVLPFGADGKETTEVVPADYMRDENGKSIYDIADGSGGWMKASPSTHNAYVRDVNSTLSNKVKPLIRFIKAWKYYKNVHISSFYLELRTTKYAEKESSIVYSIDIKNILKFLFDNDLSAIQDPKGISGYIYPCKTDTMKIDTISKLETALSRAEKAREAEISGNIKDAFYWWNLLFDDNFPSY